MATFRSVSVTRSYEQVVEQLLDRIRAGDFPPGSRLPTERDLGELFGVSRGVIREAIKVLITIGAVESRQGSGTYVADDLSPMVSHALVLSVRPEAESLSDLMEMRAPIERFAACLAAERRSPAQLEVIVDAANAVEDAAERDDWNAFVGADHRFHMAIASATGNSFLTTVMGAIREIQQNAAAMLTTSSGSMSTAVSQHAAVVEAITAGDASAAESAMAEHVRYSADALITTLTKPTPIDRRASRRGGGAKSAGPEQGLPAEG